MISVVIPTRNSARTLRRLLVSVRGQTLECVEAIVVDNHSTDETLANAAELMRETRTQKGCLDYVWSADPTDPGRIYVFERWATSEDLAAHLAGKFYIQMRDHIGAAGLTEAEALKYRIDLVEPVYDSKGVARAEFQTAPD